MTDEARVLRFICGRTVGVSMGLADFPTLDEIVNVAKIDRERAKKALRVLKRDGLVVKKGDCWHLAGGAR